MTQAPAMGANFWSANYFGPRYGQPVLEDAADMDRLRQATKMLREKGMKTSVYTGWSVSTKMTFWPYFGQAMVKKPLRFSEGETYGQCCRSPYEDYLANGIARLVKVGGISGVYLDSTGGAHPCIDEHHGCGYTDPETGERVPARAIWGTRRTFRRMYKIFHGELIDDGLVYSHAGGPPLMAIDSFIDVKHQGEAAYSARTLKEYYALPIYRAHYNPQQYGFMVEHTWQNRAAIARNSTWGVALLHDNAIKMYFHAALQRHYHADNNRGKHGIDWKMWVPHRWFDWADSQWYPYYRNGDVLSIDGEEVYGSFHLNAKKQIIFNMMNMSTKRQAVKVAFDANNLGLPATLHARDVVTDEVFEVPNGRFEIKILGERPRILLMATQPVKLPGD